MRSKINISFIQTGDPFIDLGSLVLYTIVERYPQKTEKEIIQFLIDVYIKQWKQNLYSIFHTNSKILNPSTKGKHEKNTQKYFEAIIANKEIDGCIKNGYCKTCGKYGLLYQNSREFFPNSGSGKFVNFHHSHEIGIYLCNECTFKLFFIPIGVILLDGKNGFLQLQSEPLKKFWIKRVINENLNKIARNISKGILRTSSTKSQNTLFYFVEEIIMDISNDNYTDYIQLINFTNFGANPSCTIYSLPNSTFSFLNKVLRFQKSHWYKFINRFYRIKGAKWDIKNHRWFKESEGKVNTLTKNDYLNNSNEIYEKLLANKSILRQLLNTQKMHYQNQLEIFPIQITYYYIMEVLNMTKEQIKLIAQITDVIFELSKREKNFKKYLFMLESAGKAYQLRSSLIKIIKANFQNGAEKPVIRMKDYVEYLFPDGQYWGEIRDLLLIHLYEKYHDEGINRKEVTGGEVKEAVDEQSVNVL